MSVSELEAELRQVQAEHEEATRHMKMLANRKADLRRQIKRALAPEPPEPDAETPPADEPDTDVVMDDE